MNSPQNIRYSAKWAKEKPVWNLKTHSLKLGGRWKAFAKREDEKKGLSYRRTLLEHG